MQELDIKMLNPEEQRVLNLSFYPGLTEKRIRNVALSGLIAAVAVGLFATYGLGLTAIAAMAIVILLISAAEKVLYAREILRYKALVRKLVHRVEGLEGTAFTPLESRPTDRIGRRVTGMLRGAPES